MVDTDVNELVAALLVALRDVADLARSGEFGADGQLADAAAALDAVKAADTLALDVALTNNYAVAGPDEQGRPRPVRPAGRTLNARRFTETGIAGLLRVTPNADLRLVAGQLAEHLTGPPIDIYDYAALDLRLTIQTPIPVAAGWELVTPTAAQLQAALPVSVAAPHHGRGWDPQYCAGLAMLRRLDPEQEPVTDWLISFDIDPAHRLWEPLLALSLYANPVIHLYARYVVEPGRHVEPLFESYIPKGVTYDGVNWDEIPELGEFEVALADLDRFTGFLAAVAQLIEQTQSAGSNKKSAAKLRRATEHFLTAGEGAHGEGEVLSERNAETVLHYVIALEALLSGPDEDTADLTRKVAQRAAVLAGRDDGDRLAVHRFVRTAYRARSRFAHGEKPDEVPTPGLRDIVRRCLLARLVIGDPPAGYRSLAALADEALLAEQLRQEKIAEPLRAFADTGSSGSGAETGE